MRRKNLSDALISEITATRIYFQAASTNKFYLTSRGFHAKTAQVNDRLRSQEI